MVCLSCVVFSDVLTVLLFFQMSLLFVIFFFCKQKTAYEMRISDWSSDVCSSDLCLGDDHAQDDGAGHPLSRGCREEAGRDTEEHQGGRADRCPQGGTGAPVVAVPHEDGAARRTLPHRLDRKRVV